VPDRLVAMMVDRFDTNRNGKISFPEFAGRLSGYLNATDANLRRMGLERVLPTPPAVVASSAPASAAPSASGGDADAAEQRRGSRVASPHVDRLAATRGSAHAAVSGGAGTITPSGLSASGARPPARGLSDGASVATLDMDLGPTAAKMRKVLGRAWLQVLADVHKRAALKRANSGAAATGGVLGKEAVVTGEVFRDAMAMAGVPLTGKEVRALTGKFAGGDGGLAVGKLIEATIGASRTASGAGRHAASPRK
jgi:hypothetical protein